MANHGYYLRTSGQDYRELTSVKLPKACKISSKDKLYPIEVVETDGSRARIHYIGYGDSNDEWRDLSELVTIPDKIQGNKRSSSDSSNATVHIPIQQYSLYNELRIKIKQALVCHRGKMSPTVTIDMGFDYLLFKGGLQAVGVAKQSTYGNITRYKLTSYKDLDPLLGHHWHYRGANKNGDYAFVILSSVEYHIHKRRKISEYHPPTDTRSMPVLHTEDSGYALKFHFTCGYGNRLTFGMDRNIFNIS